MGIPEFFTPLIKKGSVFFLTRIKQINTRFKVILLLTILTAMALPVNLRAHKDDIRFEHLSLEHGLSNVVVHCILQDSQGFMWFGTREGLNKFDGYTFTVYRPNPENRVGMNNNIRSIFEDSGGDLWIGTYCDGLYTFNRKTETFTRYQNQRDNPHSISSNGVYSIFEDSSGSLWIGTRAGGLNKFNRKQETFTHYRHRADNPLSLSHNDVCSILEDSGGNLWIGTLAGGLNKLDPEQETFTHYRHRADDPHSLSSDWVRSILEDSNGNLWIGTHGGGLNKFDRKTETFIHYQHQPENANSLSHNDIYSILEDSGGSLWIGTTGGGINKFDPKKESFTRCRHRADNPHSLSSDCIRSIFEDSGGNLWIATCDGGLNLLYGKTFTPVQHQVDTPPSLGLNDVKSFFEDSSGRLWIGTDCGLNKFNPETQTFTLFQNQVDNPHSLSHNDIRSIFEDSAGGLWIGTYGGGLNKFDRKTETFIRYQHQPENADSLSHNFVRLIFEDSTGNLWIGTNRGLNRFDDKQETFHRCQHQADNPNSLSNNTVKTMCEDSAGRLWIGTSGGLNKFTGRRETFIRYQHQADNPHSLSNNYVISILEDSAGSLWIGTWTGGLNKFDGTEETFVHFREKDGLPDNTIYGILEDDNGNLWMSTNKGISKFNPQKGTFTNYDEKDGLQGNEFNEGAYHKGKSGMIYFGGINGFNAFYPDHLRDNTYILPVVITDFLLFNKSVPIAGHSSKVGGFKLEQHINFTREITLDHTYYIFALEFSALNYRQPGKNQYAYKLEGLDKDWVKIDAKNRRAAYMNLPDGEYIFRVKASDSNGCWNEQGTSLRIKILPPWWKTWWAYTLYALSILGLISWFIRSQRRKVIEKQKELEREKLKELDKAKSRFFANISHEFRTPLTLIMGPLEQILAKNPGKDIRDKVHLMLRNAQRLLNLINQLLELSRLDSGKMKLEASRQNIVPFVKNTVMCFQSLAQQNNTDLIFMNKDHDITLYFDAEKLEKVITNLLSNAFKYTPAGGSITVKVRKAAETGRFPSGCVEISVRDTGTGIPENQLPHIFNRFYRVEGGHEHKQKGSGIGLALTKELVELHHGEIKVQSSCRDDHSQGSEFLLRLPLGTEHLQSEEITETDKPTARRAIKSFSGGPGGRFFKKAPLAAGGNTPKEEAVKEKKPLVLVVEDNNIERLYIKTTLELQFSVVEAADGKEGILRAKEIIPDLIVSDIIMPEIDGYELCRTLKKDVLTSHIPIILLTAKGSEASVRQGLETGADDYLTKPFNKSLLVVRVRNLIELRRQLQREKKNRMTLLPEGIPVSPLDDEFYKKLLDALEENLSDPDFNVEALSRKLQMSHAALYRKIQGLTGKTPTLFIRSFRLKRAAQLLQTHTGNVSDVADKVGFTDKSYFAKCFKEQFHCLPSDLQPSGAARGFDGEEFETSEVPAGSTLASGNSKPGKEIALVVEDNDDARGYIRESLEPDYRVVEAVDGSEGLARTMEIIPDLVISDIMMPGMDGYELCRLLKQDLRSCHIPVVLLTAKAGEESRIKGLELGADDYITKPFNTGILRVRIKNLIRLRSHLQKERNREMALLPAKIKEPEIHREFEKELNTAIEKNLEDPGFNVEQLAKKLYMSSATVYRKIQAISGEVPSEYIRSFRLRRAAELLKSNSGSVTEVAFGVGFNSRAYFTKCFKEKFHQLPSVYMTTG